MRGRGACVSVLVDGVRFLFRFTVLFIAGNVFLFAREYMKDDMYSHRFSYVLLLFVLSINVLIYSPNLVGMLLG